MYVLNKTHETTSGYDPLNTEMTDDLCLLSSKITAVSSMLVHIAYFALMEYINKDYTYI